MWKIDDVTKWRCDELKMWQIVDVRDWLYVKDWRCDELTIWQIDDVNDWQWNRFMMQRIDDVTENNNLWLSSLPILKANKNFPGSVGYMLLI